jgi:hypothetical protein
MILRDLATAWVKTHCPSADVQKQFLQHLEHALQREVTCSFTIGRDLTKSGRAYLVYGCSGELFIFELTMEQAGRLGVSDNMLVCAKGLPQQDHTSSSESVVCIEEITVDNATSLDRLRPITGSLRHRSNEHLFDPLAIRVVCEPPGRGRICLFHHLFHLSPPEGMVKLSLPPLGDLPDSDGSPFTGAVPLFFQIWTTIERSPRSTVPTPPVLPGAPKPEQPQPGSPMGWQPTGPLSSSGIKHVVPAMSHYPPPYDPMPQMTPPPRPEKPISDIRAVLVEIV